MQFRITYKHPGPEQAPKQNKKSKSSFALRLCWIQAKLALLFSRANLLWKSTKLLLDPTGPLQRVGQATTPPGLGSTHRPGSRITYRNTAHSSLLWYSRAFTSHFVDTTLQLWRYSIDMIQDNILQREALALLKGEANYSPTWIGPEFTFPCNESQDVQLSISWVINHKALPLSLLWLEFFA